MTEDAAGKAAQAPGAAGVADATGAALPSLPLATAQLLRRRHTAIRFAPDAEQRAAIAALLGLAALPALRLTGDIAPSGRHDLTLTARIVAQVVQPCAVTLAPVETRIDEEVVRRYLADFQEPEGTEVEFSADDTDDPLTDAIDVAAVAIEALALALPLYPRSPGADLGEAVFAPPGAQPLRDADLRPFAGLAALVAGTDPGKTDPEQGA